MNFYLSQDRARQTTRWLVVFYLLALLVLCAISSLVLLAVVRAFQGYGAGVVMPANLWLPVRPEDWPWLLGVCVFVLGGALIRSLLKMRELSHGGQSVALALGGRKIQPDTRDLQERKMLNVVEEMAIASGMPVPEVYVLDKEEGINAFAAGLTPTDAVIGVTRGAVDKLNREQLQGVVGHEFSHILNGDMRLNLRLIMLISGIEFVSVVGRIFTQSNRRSYSSRGNRKGGGGLVLAGLVLRLLGWFGQLLGRMIQAAVSRQREYLADASAVQFTRNPSAVADALKVIGHEVVEGRLTRTDTHEVSHLFFAQAFRSYFNLLFATHPPLEERIRLLDPAWDGEYLAPQKAVLAEPKSEQAGLERLQGLALAGVAQVVLSETLEASATQSEARDPLSALAAVVAAWWLAQTETAILQQAESLLAGYAFSGLQTAVAEQRQALEALSPAQRLQVIEVAMPALKSLSAAQYHDFRELLQRLMDLDGRRDLYEQVLAQLVLRFLDVHFGLAKPHGVRYRRLSSVTLEVQLLLSMLADYGHETSQNALAQRAYERAMQVLGLPGRQPMETAGMSAQTFEQATHKLALCSPELKQQIVRALLACAEYDHQLLEVERELIVAIAATLDVPIPRALLEWV
ncbi:M48 family metallopeptidase [Thiomicrorhabdus cannonii]|uniref:M48 family metallopeptidase n=1 Tax=Thiomicrorhabdus cannonii TaxID=2748011 RepID=UPI0015BB3069|nr:M48 family metallopeptidase [Thiomicrorhabdus cannonii]